MKLQHPICGQDDVFIVGLALQQQAGLELKDHLQQLGYQVILMTNSDSIEHLICEGYFDALVYDPKLEGAENVIDTASTRMFPFSCISTGEDGTIDICSKVKAAHGKFIFPRTTQTETDAA
ncbi:MAG TPA: hypothetical protein V6C81_23920 [Planktothrix sp.]|jgi:hypothetical protein